MNIFLLTICVFICQIATGNGKGKMLSYRMFGIDSFKYVNQHYRSNARDNHQLFLVVNYNDVICKFDSALVINCRLLINDYDSITKIAYAVNNENISFSERDPDHALLTMKNIAISEGEQYFLRFTFYDKVQNQFVDISYDPYNSSVLQVVRKDVAGKTLSQSILRR